MIDVTDALESRATDLVVMDTAPSGHALRLLEMPALVHDWAKALMSILLKYQPVVAVGQLGTVLLQLSQGLGRLRALLTDSERTSFIIVTRPATLPAASSAARRRLGKLSVNRTVDAGQRCRPRYLHPMPDRSTSSESRNPPVRDGTAARKRNRHRAGGTAASAWRARARQLAALLGRGTGILWRSLRYHRGEP